MSTEQSCEPRKAPLFGIVSLHECKRFCRLPLGIKSDDRLFRRFLKMMMHGKINLNVQWFLDMGDSHHAKVIANGLNTHFGAKCSVLLGDVVCVKSGLSEDEINLRINQWRFYLTAVAFRA